MALAAATSARAADASDVRQKAEAVARDLDVQQRLPNDSGTSSDDERSGSLRWSPQGMDGPDVFAPAAFWEILQWALLAVAAITVAAWLGIWISESYQRRMQSAVPRARVRPGDEQATPLDPAQALALADEWAAAG